MPSPFAPTPLHSYPPREYMGMQASRMAFEYDRNYHQSKTPSSRGSGSGPQGSPYGPDGGWGGDYRKPLGDLNWSEPRAGANDQNRDFGTFDDDKDENGRGFMVSPAIAVSRRGGSKRFVFANFSLDHLIAPETYRFSLFLSLSIIDDLPMICMIKHLPMRVGHMHHLQCPGMQGL